jgi:hypothetical protein
VFRLPAGARKQSFPQGPVLPIYRICAYGSHDQAGFVAKINQIQSAMDARKPPVRAWQFGKQRPPRGGQSRGGLRWQYQPVNQRTRRRLLLVLRWQVACASLPRQFPAYKRMSATQYVPVDFLRTTGANYCPEMVGYREH